MNLGDKILGYRLEQEVGEGGMGVVYKGVSDLLGQEVAVKVLDPILARNADVRERFIQEARIQIGLQHQGIVRVLTAQVEQEPLALVMEYVDGLPLSKVIERRQQLPLDEATTIMVQVLAAIGYAHQRGVVHRDLKPSNIMVMADGHAKVMDFGIAKVVGSAKLTRTGTAMGSAHYMSPEQVLGRKSIDHRTDIYSAGITFFEMLTGHTPFEDHGGDSTDSDFLIKQAHVQLPPPDPRKFVPGLPEGIVALLTTALEKDPAKRFQTAADFGEALHLDKKNARKEAERAERERQQALLEAEKARRAAEVRRMAEETAAEERRMAEEKAARVRYEARLKAQEERRLSLEREKQAAWERWAGEHPGYFTPYYDWSRTIWTLQVLVEVGLFIFLCANLYEAQAGLAVRVFMIGPLPSAVLLVGYFLRSESFRRVAQFGSFANIVLYIVMWAKLPLNETFLPTRMAGVVMMPSSALQAGFLWGSILLEVAFLVATIKVGMTTRTLTKEYSTS